MAEIVFISPRFTDCFWGLDLAIKMGAKKASIPQLCLPLLAALTPEAHRVILIDENIEAIDYKLCASADIVGVTGMSIQRFQMRQILSELKKRGCFTVVGGPWVSSQEEYFAGLADVVFVGEVEDSWPRFLKDWQAGRHAALYEQAESSDLTKIPPPRYDLLKMKHYAFGTVQFSRGCPHQCEFCGITVMFGRKPRYKTGAQVIAELAAIRRLGQRFVFVVDDNLICDKQALTRILLDVIAWQQQNGYPLALITQATINIADDQELMDLMVKANFIIVFIGVESPSPEALRETGKLINLRQGESLLAKLRRIQQKGFVVWCGMIQGFDHDDSTIFQRQLDFLTAGRIPIVMSGMLTAFRKTPLYDRLEIQKRLDLTDPPRWGTNVIPAGMSGEDLRDGYVRMHVGLYSPESYFQRLDALFLDPDFEVGFARQQEYWCRHRLLRFWRESVYALQAAGVFFRMMLLVHDSQLRREYRRRVRRFLRVHRRPGLILNYLLHILMQYHAWILAEKMNAGQMPVINTY
jgi:hypothetical protein